jgi:hypothetical protein
LKHHLVKELKEIEVSGETSVSHSLTMDQFFKLKESVMGFLSPSSKRRRTMMPSTPAEKLQRPIQAVSEPRNHRQKAVLAGRVSKKYLSPADTRRTISKRKDSDDEYEEEVEHELDDTTVLSHSNISPDDSVSQIGSRSRDDTAITEPEVNSDEDLDLDEEEESELDAEAKVHQFLDRQTELARRQETLAKIKEGDWHEDEIALFSKLSMRGFEPLLPGHWRRDFRTCPGTIFSDNEEDTYLNTKSGDDFRGNFLSYLFSIIFG